MPDLEPQIAAWRAAMHAAFPRQPEVVDELEDHLRENIAVLIKAGVTPEAAVAQAAARIGSPQAVAVKFQEITPKHDTWKAIRFERIFQVVATVALGTWVLSWGFGLCYLLAQVLRSEQPLGAVRKGIHEVIAINVALIFAGTFLLWMIWPWRKSTNRSLERGLGVKIVTVVLALYWGLMFAGWVGIVISHIQRGVAPWTAQGDPAFFFRLIVCLVGGFILWKIWPWRALRMKDEAKLAE